MEQNTKGNVQGKNIDISKVRMAVTIEIDEHFQLGADLIFSGVASVVKHEVGDNQDGTVNITHIVRPSVIKFQLNK